jgi:hypothetical protein
MNKEKLMKMASAVRTGGKGSVRRYVVLVSLFSSSSAVLCLFSLVALVFLGFEAAVDCRGSSVL